MKRYSFGTNILTYLWVLPILISCSNLIGGDIYEKSVHYSANFRGQGWQVIEAEKSDHAFQHPQSKSILILNTLCKKYASANLENLAENLLSGIQNLKITTKEKTEYASREALKVQAEGKIDGRPVFLKILTTQKNRCIYDFALITSSKDYLKLHNDDFRNFISQTDIR